MFLHIQSDIEIITCMHSMYQWCQRTDLISTPNHELDYQITLKSDFCTRQPDQFQASYHHMQVLSEMHF